ncbi:MAG: hypothetical protein LBF59_07255 [Prevotellaceae bacterium]|jgi:hypothetical protein|nr:hypothetical protein [Prevotellaceae bacterium]
MTKEEYLEIAASRYEELEALKEKDNFYDYEKSFDQIWQDLGRLYLENSLNEQSSTKDRRKKKRLPSLEK